MLESLRSAAFRSGIARPIASASRSEVRRAGIFGRIASKSSECLMGLCAGSWHKEKQVTLANGTVIDPEEVLGLPERGKKLVIIGDAEATEGLAEQLRDADVLVIEATFLERDASIARDLWTPNGGRSRGVGGDQ
jgi:ribonuclease BN (tRNA processing enzyme)